MPTLSIRLFLNFLALSLLCFSGVSYAQQLPRLISNASNFSVSGGLGENCLEVHAFDVKALDIHEGFLSEDELNLAWKVEVANHCAQMVKAFIHYEIIDTSGRQLIQEYLAFYIPKNTNRYVATGPNSLEVSAENSVARSHLTVEGEKYLLEPSALRCLTPQILGPLFIEQHPPFFGFFTIANHGLVDQSVGIDVVNSCSSDLVTNIEFVAHDAEGYYLAREFPGIYVPSDSVASSRFFMEMRDNRYAVTSFYSARPVFFELISRETFYFSKASRWIPSQVPSYNEIKNSVTLQGEVANVGDFEYELVSTADSERRQFRIDSSTFKNLNTMPRISSDYSAQSGELIIPVVEVGGEIIAENVKLVLTDQDSLTFSLQSSEAPLSRSAYVDTTARRCIRIDNTEWMEEVIDEQTVEYSVAVELTNLCLGEEIVRLRHRLLNQDDMLLNNKVIRNFRMPGRESMRFETQYSIDLTELADTPAREEIIVTIGFSLLGTRE